MESIRENATFNSKYNLHADSSQLQCDVQRSISSESLPTSRLQNPSLTHNQKRPNSIPFTFKRDTERLQSVPHFKSECELPINNSKNIGNVQIQTQNHPDNSNIFVFPLPHYTTNKSEIHTSTDLQSDVFSVTQCKSAVPPRIEQSMPSVSANENLQSAHNSIGTSSEEGAGVIMCQIFSSGEKQNIRIFPEHHYEEIDEINNHCTVKCSNADTSTNEEMKQKFDENRTFFTKVEKLVKPANPRCQDSEGQFASVDYEEPKIKMRENNVENDKDGIWKNYTERPILPLKPLQKQRSMSCVNLVQTIKGLSKRKTSGNSRHLSPVNHIKTLLFPENALVQKKEPYTSEANILEMKTELVASADLTNRGLNGNKEFFPTKNSRQSLLPNYTWFHPIEGKEASKRLLKMQQNGAFLIRPASNPTSEVLHTLCVAYSRRVYNFHVKSLKDGRITLGKFKGLREAFSSLLDMIKYHQTVPITINLTESNQVAYVYLLITPPK